MKLSQKKEPLAAAIQAGISSFVRPKDMRVGPKYLKSDTSTVDEFINYDKTGI